MGLCCDFLAVGRESDLRLATGDSRAHYRDATTMDVTILLIHLISGALGGNAAAAVSKNDTLGTLGNTLAGAIGGAVGGHILTPLLGMGTAVATSGLDIGTLVTAILTGGVSGGILAFVLALLKSKLA